MKKLAFLPFLIAFFCILYADLRVDSKQDNILGDTIVSEYDFITANEYGKYLYENPRGISCKRCHGEFGEGKMIAKYIKNGKEVELKAPNIVTLSKEKFELALINSKGVMPKYYLTKQEIDAIYAYIKSNTQNTNLDSM